jgi:hypothetical protein
MAELLFSDTASSLRQELPGGFRPRRRAGRRQTHAQSARLDRSGGAACCYEKLASLFKRKVAQPLNVALLARVDRIGIENTLVCH